jgi:serine/threonine protein kinase
MLGTVEEIDYDGDRVRTVVLRFPALRAGDAEVVKEVRACERIGQGSFGTVYRAVCEDYPRLALKISTGKSTRLRQELDVLSRVCTKGRLLLPRFEFGALNKTADLIVIGMELCVPSTLHDLLLSTRITSEAEMLFMAYQVVQAVSYVHEEGCIHRDIKLQNFVFDLDGNLKLIDFGLACNSLNPPAGDVVAGTVSFMSPEMAHNALHKERRVSVGVAADVWSLGIVLFSIFTQRNPYPLVEPTTSSSSAPRNRSSSAGANGETASPHEAPSPHGGNSSGRNKNDLSAQQRMNEQLLRRVASGDWQWPVGVGVSEDLKQLVNSILITNPDKRPTVAQILQNKLWNLRRRYPPAAVVAFLGVQDDFLLSHDEAHLLRAVEERSAGVTASLMHSRMQSPDNASSASSPPNDAAGRGGADRSGHRTRSISSHQLINNTGAALGEDEQQQRPLSGTTTPPLRSSLKVVQRGGEGGVDGAVAVQVYDVRASTRKRSKPIREISIVMAEETAKRHQARSRGQRGQTSAPVVKTTTTAAFSAPVSRRPSRASSLIAGDEGGEEGELRRASSMGVSLQLPPSSRTTPAMVLDHWAEGKDGKAGQDSDDVVVEVPRPLQKTASLYVSLSRSQQQQQRCADGTNASPSREDNEEEAEEAKAAGTDGGKESFIDTATSAAEASAAGASASTELLISMTASSTASKPSGAVLGGGEGQRCGSVELVESNSYGARHPVLGDTQDDNQAQQQQRQGSRSVMTHRKGRATTSDTRSRDTSLWQASSSILHGATRPHSQSLSTAAPSATEREVKMAVAESSARRATVSAEADTNDHCIACSGGATLPEPSPAKPSSQQPSTRAQRVALELSLNVLWQDEADHRRYLSSALLIEHEWLLASFRLTIEEDQERYNVTWLAEEQEKSAAHPHRFKEMTRVTSKKYQYGFVCDLCDYEFLPDGPDEKDLHYFHCPCGRDLCPDCFEEYQRQCTCSCCRVVHQNSCVLRQHLQETGGVQLYGGLKGIARGAAAEKSKMKEKDVDVEVLGGAPSHRRGRGCRSEQLSNGHTKSPTAAVASRKGIRAAKDTGRRRRRGGGGAAAGPDTTLDVDVDEDQEIAQIRLPRMSVAAMQQERVVPASAQGSSRRGRGAAESTHVKGAIAAPPPQQQLPEDMEVKQRPVEHLPEGPWRPFARFKKDRKEEAARQPTPEERNALLNGEWIRYFYLFPNTTPDARRGGAGEVADDEDPYALVYHAQPGRTGAVFLTSDFPMHSAVFSMLERQFFVVDQVDTVDGADATRATSLLRAKGQADLKIAFQALQDIVAYDTNMMKQQRTPGTVSVYQAPRSAYSCNGEPFLYVRWFRFNEDRTLSAFLLSNGAVQMFVNNEYELRWFDESRKFIIRYNGVCELVEDNMFTLAPAINHLLYDSFDA